MYVFRSDYSRRTKRNEKDHIFQTLHASLCKAKSVYFTDTYLCYHSKLCCQQKLSRLRIKHCFHKRRRQQHLYIQTRACSQRLRKAYPHWLLRNSGTTVNTVRGIEKEIFANYWRQKYPNGTWWEKVNKNYTLLHTRFRERCSTVPHQGVILIRSRYSQTRTSFRTRK